MFFTDTHKLNKTAYNALKRIRDKNKKESIDLIAEANTQTAKRNFNIVFQEYDDSKFEEKVKLDSYIYNKLFEGLSSEESNYVSGLISEMVTDVKNVYKFINIEPKITGFKNLTSADSRNSLINEASDIINNHFNKEYYSLSTDEKKRKYSTPVLGLAQSIVVEENISSDEAVIHSYKTILIENLIKNINFPYIIKHKIEEIFNNDLYNDLFDIEELTRCMDSFEIKTKNIARIAAAN